MRQREETIADMASPGENIAVAEKEVVCAVVGGGGIWKGRAWCVGDGDGGGGRLGDGCCDGDDGGEGED